MHPIEYLQQKKNKDAVLRSLGVAEFAANFPEDGRRQGFTENPELFEQCFWTIKNFPNTKHDKPLMFPEMNKASDFFTEIRYYSEGNTPNDKFHHIIFQHYNSIINGKYGDILHQNLEISDKESNYAYCVLKDNARNMFIDAIYITLKDSPDGVLIMANLERLGIIQEWDLKIHSSAGNYYKTDISPTLSGTAT